MIIFGGGNLAPTTEQLILMELKGFRLELTKQGQDIAEIKGKMAIQDRSCSDCKTGIDNNLNVLYERVHNVEIEDAKKDGMQVGKEQAISQVEEVEDKKIKRWVAVGGLAFSAGASLVAMWPAIKSVLVAIVTP